MPSPRGGLKFWAMAALMVFFSVSGLGLVVFGKNAHDRLTGAMCLLFFGLGGLAYVGGALLTRRGPGTVRAERVQTSAGSEAAFVFPTPAAKRWVVIVAAGGMAAGSALLIPLGGVAIGVIGTVLFGGGFLALLLSARRPQRLALTPTRVVSSTPAGTVELPWEAVAAAEVYELPAGRTTVSMLGIAATDPDAAVWTRGSRLGRLNRRMSGFDLSAGADTFAGEAEAVVAAILRYRDEPGRRRAIGGEEEHALLLRELGESPARDTEALAEYREGM